MTSRLKKTGVCVYQGTRTMAGDREGTDSGLDQVWSWRSVAEGSPVTGDAQTGRSPETPRWSEGKAKHVAHSVSRPARGLLCQQVLGTCSTMKDRPGGLWQHDSKEPYNVNSASLSIQDWTDKW